MDNRLQRLTADLESIAFLHGVEQGFWELVTHEEFLVRVRLNAPDTRSYLVQLDCREYGDEPIAGQFVDADGHCVQLAWPPGNGTFQQWIKNQNPHLFICWDQDRTGIEKHHPEWKVRKAWTKNKNQLVAYLDFLRRLLHLPALGYERRAEQTTA